MIQLQLAQFALPAVLHLRCLYLLSCSVSFVFSSVYSRSTDTFLVTHITGWGIVRDCNISYIIHYLLLTLTKNNVFLINKTNIPLIVDGISLDDDSIWNKILKFPVTDYRSVVSKHTPSNGHTHTHTHTHTNKHTHSTINWYLCTHVCLM